VLRFVLRRCAASLLLLYVVLTATFFLIHAAPGNPANLLLEDRRVPFKERQALLQLYGLDRPLPVQYARWLAATAQGNLGMSFSRQQPVIRVIADALPATLLLALAALVVEQTVGLTLGMIAARRNGLAADHLIRIASLLLYSQPVFWLGLIAMLLFAVHWPVLPSGQLHSTGAEELGLATRTMDLLWHLTLPALVLGLSLSGGVVRLTRATLLEVLGQEHIRAARAKGLSERRVMWVHALRSAAAPLLQALTLSLSALLGGALVTEVVFSWPGLGQLTLDAILSRDYPLILGTTALSAVLVLLGNLMADVLHAWVDPRVRHA
jgi:peptide/nickel transport system permease protein